MDRSITFDLMRGFDYPVRFVTALEGDQFCKDIGLRLPSATEWEWAALGGINEARYGGLDAIAWYSGDSFDQGPYKVMQKKPNAYGLYDMLGNLAEWVGTEYLPGGREVRGGSWYSPPEDIRASARIRWGIDGRSHNIGFRCAGDGTY